MNRPIQWALRLLTRGCVTAFALAGTALVGTAVADDAEIFIPQSTVTPNILLILDTSGSMGGEVTTQDEFDPSRNYVSEASGNCASISGRVFYKLNNQGTPPGCGNDNWVNTTEMRCASASSPLATTGSYPGDRFTQWRQGSDSIRSWRDVQGGNHNAIDCRNDGAPYPDRAAFSTSNTPAYTNTDAASYWDKNSGGGTSVTLYSANYVAYYAQFRNVTTSTRLRVMQQAAKNLLNSVTNVNVGLMRYSLNTAAVTDEDPIGNGGGMVIAPVAPIAQNRDTMISLIDNFVANGNTPLSETLYEAHQYLSGGSVYFGNKSRGCFRNSSGTSVCQDIPSVASSRVGGSGNRYLSPLTQSCQKTFIVYLTDGEPTSDNQTDSQIKTLTGSNNGCTGDSNGDGTPDANGSCLGLLSEYLNDDDTDLNPNVADVQNVTTYYIGFGSDFGGTSNAAFNYLSDAARRGGGEAYQAGDLSELSQVFTDIFNAISADASTLTAPTVAVNAFNRTRTLDDIYLSVFQPTGTLHWPGNVKKFRIGTDDTKLLAKGNVNAIGTGGVFLDTVSDYWSETGADGSNVERGGSARKIPAPANRDVYTYFGTQRGVVLKGNTNAEVKTTNALLTDAVLGTDTNNPTRDKLIEWARGADVDDLNEDRSVVDQRYDMGDPMHSQPAVVIYGGSPGSQNRDDAVVFTATNDGYLHAFSTTSGEELWAFIPKELLAGLKPLYNDNSSQAKNYAIDGDLRVLKYDTNGDGIVNPNDSDRVLLFFSTGRNRTVSRYYALDVTSKDSPQFLWSIGPNELPGLGQAWSRPTITRVNINNETQNTQRLVLVFGGGYDPLEEGYAFRTRNDVGNRVFMVDALYGSLLWSAGDDRNTSTATLKLARMTHSIPAPVNIVDLNGDSFADRLYVGDMGGQVWRFDIYNGKSRGDLVTGGVIASLGAKDTTATNANTRRFYNSPDAAIVTVNNRPFMNIAIGSGYRGHPLSTQNQDRFYALREYQPLTTLTQTQFNNYDIITEDELDDITTNFAPTLPANTRGWLLQLNYPTYMGEKVLSSSSTFNNALFFTTYTPSSSATSNMCSVAQGSNRAYAISVVDGSPLPRRDGATTPPTGPNPPPPPPPPGPTDRYTGLGQTGIAPEVTLLFPDKDRVKCLAGVEVLSVCKDFNSRIKTYWRQTNAN